MNMSVRGRKMLAQFEGLKLTPYNCPAGYATIGVGHLIARRPVSDSDRIAYAGFTQEDAMRLLSEDLDYFERAVLKNVPATTTQFQFDALVSFAYNIGLGNFASSSVLRNLRRGYILKAAASFELFNKVRNPKTKKLELSAGLVRRRAREKNLFLTGEYCAKIL